VGTQALPFWEEIVFFRGQNVRKWPLLAVPDWASEFFLMDLILRDPVPFWATFGCPFFFF
jgi:hypothetical protein